MFQATPSAETSSRIHLPTVCSVPFCALINARINIISPQVLRGLRLVSVLNCVPPKRRESCIPSAQGYLYPLLTGNPVSPTRRDSCIPYAQGILYSLCAVIPVSPTHRESCNSTRRE